MSVLVVLLIVLQLAPLSTEDSQCKILLVYPVSVSVPLLAVAQTVLLADNVPGTVCGSTVMVTVSLESAHVPFEMVQIN